MKQSDRKAETKRRLQNAASRAFKSMGYAGVGVDGLSKQANATSGAFYAHLGSKSEAFQDTLERGLDDVISALPKYQAEHGGTWASAFADYYLGRSHVKDTECGCAMVSLSSDVARGNDDLKKIYEDKMTVIAELIAGGLNGQWSDDDRLARAWAFLSVLIGGVTIARSMKSDTLAARIAEDTKAFALSVLTLK